MATAPPKPPMRPAPPTPGGGNSIGATAKPAMTTSGSFTAEQLSPDSTAFPPLYEAALLYSADCYDAAEQVLKENLRTKEGKDSLRVWLMLFDLYQLTNNRKEFDALSMLFTVKFERSPPVWTSATEATDPRRKEKRERKDFYAISPTPDGGLLAEIDKFEAFAKEMGSCRIGFEKVKSIHNEEAELLSLVFNRLRRMKIPMWFNGLADFAALLRKSINDLSGQPVTASQGYWSLLFELYILDGKHDEYEELGLEYAVAFEMSPPAWENVVRPGGAADDKAAAGGADAAAPAEAGLALRGVFSANSRDMLQQLASYSAGRQQEVLVDLSALMRIDFSATSQFFEAVRAIHLAQ